MSEYMVEHSPSRAFAERLGMQPTWGAVTYRDSSLGFVKFGTGPAVVVLHGIDIGWGQWHPNIRELSKYFTLYLFDLPGVGRSSSLVRSGGLEDRLVAPLEFTINQLSLSGSHVIAHSIGAWVALKIAERGNVSVGRLVLSGPLGFSTRVPLSFYPATMPFVARFLARVVVGQSPAGLSKILEGMLEWPENLTADFLNYYAGSLEAAGPEAHPLVFMSTLCEPLRLSRELSLQDALTQISNETLFIIGEQDYLVPLSKVQRDVNVMRNARIALYPQCGHVPGFERPVQFNKDAIDFLSR